MNKENYDLDGFVKGRRWKAETIYAPALTRENGFALFRKCFRARDTIKNANIYIAARTHYRLFANGNSLGKGPVISQPYLQYYDIYQLPDFYPDDEICIAVEVNQINTEDNSHGALRLEVMAEDGTLLMSTGKDWRCTEGIAWMRDTYRSRMNILFPFQECLDNRLVPENWKNPGFDDSGWDTPLAISGKNEPRILPRSIPMMEYTEVFPEKIENMEECIDLEVRTRAGDFSIGLSAIGRKIEKSRLDNPQNLLKTEGTCTAQASQNHLDRIYDGRHDPCITLDMGKVVTAYIELDIEGEAGSAIDIGYAERLVDGRFNNAIECCFADRVILKNGRQGFTTFAWRAFRYIKLRFKECDTPLTIHKLAAIQTRYPFKEEGSFTCNDEILDGVFQISRNTLRLCCHDGIFDTPFREQAQWLGDVAAVTVPGIYACFGDTALPGKFLQQSGANQSATGMIANISNSEMKHGYDWSIPDFSLWWVMALWEHYLYAGEERWLHKLYPQATRVIQNHLEYINDDGFIEDMPYWVFIDWANIDKRGECTPFNAIFVGALEAYGKIANFKGDNYMAEMANSVSGKIRNGFQQSFFNKKHGCFADGRYQGKLSEMNSEHASLAAIRWNLCDKKCCEEIITRLYINKDVKVTECQPFFMSVVLKALAESGHTELALELVKQRWGERMLKRGLNTCSEEWGINGSWRNGNYKGFERTLSHAWSACPAEFLERLTK